MQPLWTKIGERGFIKGKALGKLTDYEVILSARFYHAEKKFFFQKILVQKAFSACRYSFTILTSSRVQMDVFAFNVIFFRVPPVPLTNFYHGKC